MHISLKRYLVRLIALCVLPLIVLAIYLAYTYIDNLSVERDRQAEDLVNNLAVALDRNLGARIAALQLMAASPLAEDLSRHSDYYRQAQGFRDHLGGHIILADTDMQMLFNTRVAYGEPLPKLPRPKGRAAAPETLETGRPAVGDQFFGPIAKEPLIAIVVPVAREGRIIALLLNIIGSDIFQKRLDVMGLPDGWRLSLLDSERAVIARRTAANGTTDVRQAESARLFETPLTNASWTVTLDIPASIYRASVTQTGLQVCAMIALAILASVLGGRLGGGRLNREVAALAADTTQAMRPGTSSIFEIAEARRRLECAAAERLAAIDALQERQLSLQNERDLSDAVLDSLPGIFYLYDDERRFLRWNRNFLRVTGCSEAEMKTRHPLDFFAGADRELLTERIQEVFDKGEASAEADFVTSAGERIRHYFTGRRIELEGRPCLLGVGIDISERQRLMEELRESEARLSLTLDLTGIGIWDWDLVKDVWYATPTYFRMLGYDPDVEGQNREVWGERTHPDDREYVIGKMIEVRDQGLPGFDIELRFRHANGSYVWLNSVGRAIEYDERGKAVRMLGLQIDITERKQAETALQKAKTFAEEVIQTANVMFVQLDAEGRVARINGTAEKVTGYRQEEVAGANWFERLVPKTRFPEVWDEFERITRQGEVAEIFENPILTKDGRQRHILWKNRQLKEEGRVSGTLSFGIDITERMQAEEEIRKLNAELEQRVAERTTQLSAANRELEAFSYSVSHDLKAPLRGIDGYSRLLMEDCRDQLGDEARLFLSKVREGTALMHRLIDDLLDYSRLERREQRVEGVDLSGLVHSITRACLAEGEGVKVHLSLAVPPLRVTADRDGLVIALRNLVDNALKFSSAAERPEIEIGARQEGDKVLLWVRDNGIGFDMRFRERIFEMFQRLQRSEDYPGTGIGLTMVRKVMERMGGRVWAESAPGAGATFYLEIPT